ncbi:anaphase-promoting complex component Cut20/Apc4 [Trichophyton equinum CBS 127.97]|uniref:Anaphase-promoting complex subunit 4 n=1 Tax=Trichophyton equinum (strain ATCC MYA-4606 / CBS 127.97) TaxID=559882 RepID=F2Q2D5_TRIEC|nr:anaphase-promoting complex component Cut20/Apc4 [Trichophyton equinum CBS 127.97]
MASPASPSAIAAEEEEPVTLNSVAEKDLTARCKPRTIAYCPNMDLVAVVTEDEQVNVYRLNGQRVFGGAYGLGEEDGEKGVMRAVGLRWKENVANWFAAGRVLAVACSDNRIRLLSSYSGKMVHSLTAEPAQAPFSSQQRPSGSLSCIGWGVSFAETDSLLKNLKDPEGKLSLDDLLMSDTKLALDGSDGDTSKGGGYKTLLHASHPMSTTHALLFQSEAGMKLLNLDLRFITKAGRYLPLLASKVTQLQNLLRYIKQVQAQMLLEWKNARELPIRYLRNINEELKEQCHCDFVTATYHLIVTGDCYAPLKEFLTTTISDRGQKRWEKTVAGGYEALRRLTYECLMPALERCGVLLSRLIGLSKYHRISPILGLETTYLKACVATLDCLTLLAHKVVLHSSIELKEFHAFSHWMQHEIKLQSTDPTSSTIDELVEAADEIDYGTTLGYVKGALTNSALQGFLQVPQPQTAPGTDPEDRKRWDVDIQDDGTFYEEYKKAVSQHESQGSVEGLSIPMLGDLTARLSAQCDRVFKQIAETQRRGTLFRSTLKLDEDCDDAVLDMAMNFEMLTGWAVYIYRHILSVVNGVSSTKASLRATVELGSGSIQDLKFVEDGTLMLLWNIPYLPSKHDKVEIDFTAAEPAGSLHLALDRLVCHSFAPSSSSDREPVHLEVNGRRGRRVVCVLYADGRRYSVLDLDSALD